ncbi:MAG: alpha-2-macroglobulin, partial [Bacteroidetes bacterium]
MKNKTSLCVLAGIFLPMLLFFSFQNNPKPMTPNNYDDYAAAWKVIDSLESRGLPKSALEKVLVLLDKAKKEKNTPQIAKCLIYRAKYESQLEEDGIVKAIQKWSEEIEEAEGPLRALLQSMLAELYTRYLDTHRWQIQDRTETPTPVSDDIRTWTIGQLLDKAAGLYWASLENEDALKEDLSDFQILLTSRETENLRPTLFDFLAHRAIDYFANEQAHLTQPVYAFYVDNPEWFAPAGDFVKMKIETADTTSFKYRS